MIRSIFGITILTLCGCATTTYRNPNIADPATLQQQWSIDYGQCTAVATGSVPQPPLRVYSSSQTGPYYIEGEAITVDQSGNRSTTTFTGKAYQQPTADIAGSVANGFAIGQAARASRDRATVVHGCLSALGWISTAPAEVPTNREIEEFRRRADPVREVPELAEWRDHDPEKWATAQKLDAKLRIDQEWVGRTNRERYEYIISVVKASSE